MIAQAGAHVAITSTTDRIHDRVAELKREGLRVSGHVADLTVPADARSLVAAIELALGPVDILVNSAGLAQSGTTMITKSFLEMSPDDWSREVDLNLTTAFHATQAALGSMAARGYGRVIMVSSVTGPVAAVHRLSGYAAAKAGLDGMMRAIALEYGRLGVTANSVAPGWIATGASMDDELAAGRHTPVGRPGRPEEVAALIVFLASEEASYVTGQSIVVDGGNMIQEAHGIDPYSASPAGED
jgi:3-oxoacyl-[acyl-carrier protein] reductase